MLQIYKSTRFIKPIGQSDIANPVTKWAFTFLYKIKTQIYKTEKNQQFKNFKKLY